MRNSSRMTSTYRDVILHKLGREHGEGYENELDRRARSLWTSSVLSWRLEATNHMAEPDLQANLSNLIVFLTVCFAARRWTGPAVVSKALVTSNRAPERCHMKYSW